MKSPLFWYEAAWNRKALSHDPRVQAANQSSPLYWVETAWRLGPTADLGENNAPSFGQAIRQGWSRLKGMLSASSEPRIWQSTNGHGAIATEGNQTLWNAYDPVTGRSIQNVSEAEIQAWLEARYYQTPIGH